MEEQGMANVAASDVNGELSIEGGAIEQVADKEVAIGVKVWGGMCGAGVGETVRIALVNVPVAGVDGDMADAIAAFVKEFAELVTLFRSVAFLEEWVTEKVSPRVIGGDDFFVFEKVDGEISVADGRVIVEKMRVTVIADEMAALIPRGKQLRARSVGKAHAADEQRSTDVAG